jgi:hypothetical protein
MAGIAFSNLPQKKAAFPVPAKAPNAIYILNNRTPSPRSCPTLETRTASRHSLRNRKQSPPQPSLNRLSARAKANTCCSCFPRMLYRTRFLLHTLAICQEGSDLFVVRTLCSPLSTPRSVSLRIVLSRSVPKQSVAHVRPEFFCYVEERIQGYLLPPFVCRIFKRSIRCRVVKVGNTRGHSVSG